MPMNVQHTIRPAVFLLLLFPFSICARETLQKLAALPLAR